MGKQRNMIRKALKRKANEMRNQRNMIEINPSSASSFENGLSSSANDNRTSVIPSAPNYSYRYSPYSPKPIWHQISFAGRHNNPTFHSSFPPENEMNSYNVNMQDNLPHQQEELKSTSDWNPTGNLLNNEEQFARDMNILSDYIHSEDTCPYDNDNILDILRRLSIDYVQCLLKERNVLKNSGNKKKLKENTDFIIKRLDSMLYVFRLANKATGISKMHQEAFVSSEKVLEAVKIQLIEERLSASSPCEAPSPRFNQDQTQDLEEARKEVNMLLGELAGTQNELKKVKNELKKERDVNPLVPKLLEIRSSLVERIQCSQILKESFEKRITAEQIIFDIRWLTKDKMQCKGDKKCEEVSDTVNSSKVLTVTENEVHLVTMIASFLRIISFSVNLDYIYSYVEKVDNALSRQYIESLLKKYPTFFQEESVSGVTEKKWSYVELKPIITI